MSCLKGLISVRPFQIIERSGDLFTVGDVVKSVRTERLLSYRNLGAVSFAEVKSALAKAGLLC